MKRNIIRSCLAVALVLGQLLSGVTFFPATAALAALAPPLCAPTCAWGANGYGQLGTGNFTSSNVPAALTVVSNVVTVASFLQHSMALKSDGTVWAWGYNYVGQLGNGVISGSYTPPVQVLGLTGVIAIGVGSQHSVALKNDGTVWAWGYNNYGNLGNGGRINSSLPVQVLGLSGVRAIAVGWNHNLALLSDGTVRAWGYNANGQVGDGTLTNVLTPVPVSGLSGVIAIGVGQDHSLAVLSDGTVRAWGSNTFGALGNGTQTTSSVPVQVSGLNSVTAVTGGDLHSLALKTDGTVWAWGYNANGQLGNGTVTNSTIPVQVSDLSGVVAIDSGRGPHSLALKNDNTVWAWGNGSAGELGNGATLNSRTPVQVSNLYGAVAIAAGYQHSYAFIDTVAPTASPTQSPSANAAGWNNSDVTVNWNWTDNVGGSGIDAADCITSTTSSGEGMLTLIATCHDRAGNTGNASYTVKVDKTAPTAIASATKADSTPYTVGAWTNQIVTIHFACSDSDSGMASCPADEIVNAEGVTPIVSGIATDMADNAVSVEFGPIQIDRLSPDTTLTGSPASVSNSSAGSFTFASNESDITFECQVDAGAFAACNSPTSVNALADGAHVFRVRAIDHAGNADDTPASFDWTVDTTPPTTSINSGPASLTNQTTAAFTFSGNEAGTFQCSLDQAPSTSCTSPWSTTSLADGAHDFSVQAIDPAGNVDPNPATYHWTIDSTEPDTLINSGPAALSNSGDASFGFFSPKVGSTFECRLDNAAFAACDSPLAYTGLAEGSHTFEVRALDAAGNVDATPAIFGWVIDMTPGDTVITSGPAPLTNATAATVTFTSSKAGSTFECSLNGAAFSACASPKTVTSLADGVYTFAVRSIDTAGNVDPTPDSLSWTVDATPPATALDSVPPSLYNSSSANFSFSSNEAGSTFECSVDNAAYIACGSPLIVNALSDGAHTFAVRASDQAGNSDLTPATFNWTIDTIAPVTSITGQPANPTNHTEASFTFTSNEAGSTFECSVDNAAFSTCATPLNVAGLAAGTHHFVVKAIDPAGNADANPASYSWTIDLTPPTTTIVNHPDADSNSATAMWSFVSSEAGVFQCSLDGSAFAACTSPIGHTALTDGSHTFAVKAIDLAGNVDPNPASFTWVIDTVAPDTSIGSAPAAVSNSASATFTFASNEASAVFECSLDAAAFAACVNGDTATYNGLTNGSHTFTVRAIDRAGNADATPASYTWTVDSGAPVTTITGRPANPSNSATAVFTFVSTKAGSTFRCSLDGAAFADCASPQTYTSLADGSHTFAVQATDSAGHVETQPVSVSWTVDTSAPDTVLVDHPTALSNSASATFTFNSTEAGSTFACTVDGVAPANCASPLTLNGLSDGSHTFTVGAVDAAGNSDPAPISFTWIIDTVAPATSIGTLPINPTNNTAAAFTFSSSEANSTFACRLDGAAAVACSSPQAYSSLTPGVHTFNVKATDPAGNTDPIGASHSWTVDVTPPDTSITSQPTDPTSSTSATFAFASTEANSTFACSLDNAAFTACTSPKSYTGLALGTHTFAVKATDAAGNTAATPAAYSWTVKSGYTFTGFFQPVSNPPKINRVKAGSLIPVRFSLGGNFGTNIFAAGYPQSQPIACSTGAPLQDADVDEVETPGSTAGRFAVGGAGGKGWVLNYYNVFTRQWQYLFIWKTDRTWAGTCRQLIVQFNDGSAPHVANFRFVR